MSRLLIIACALTVVIWAGLRPVRAQVVSIQPGYTLEPFVVGQDIPWSRSRQQPQHHVEVEDSAAAIMVGRTEQTYIQIRVDGDGDITIYASETGPINLPAVMTVNREGAIALANALLEVTGE